MWKICMSLCVLLSDFSLHSCFPASLFKEIQSVLGDVSSFCFYSTIGDENTCYSSLELVLWISKNLLLVKENVC